MLPNAVLSGLSLSGWPMCITVLYSWKGWKLEVEFECNLTRHLRRAVRKPYYKICLKLKHTLICLTTCQEGWCAVLPEQLFLGELHRPSMKTKFISNRAPFLPRTEPCPWNVMTNSRFITVTILTITRHTICTDYNPSIL